MRAIPAAQYLHNGICTKLGQEPLRLTSYLSIDPEGFPVERADFEALEDSSVVQELVTDAIASARKPVNFKQSRSAMVTLEDQKQGCCSMNTRWT